MTDFRKSSFCGSAACVEVATRADQVIVRDGKVGKFSTRLVFTREEWRAFVAGVKDGQFDV